MIDLDKFVIIDFGKEENADTALHAASQNQRRRMATRIVVSLPEDQTVPVKWYGAPSAAELDTACRNAIATKWAGLGDAPIVLVDEDGDTVVLSSTLPTGLELRLHIPTGNTPASSPKADVTDSDSSSDDDSSSNDVRS